jgi:GDPmannose 4,6-dehydratase
MKKALITGIIGQDGAYLSKLLIGKNYKVYGIILKPHFCSTANLKYLGIEDKVELIDCNVLDYKAMSGLFEKIRPDEIYNLVAQSSVGDSFKDPYTTLNFNIVSTMNILDALKKICPSSKLYHASSSEMFGRVTQLPVKENLEFYPLSPYAVSKASSHWMAVNYRESYKLFVSCGILFNHESYLRPDNFFVKKVICESLNIAAGRQDCLFVGNIEAKRDFGYAPKYVEAMWLMLQAKVPGDFLVCSGESVKLSDIIYYVFKKLDIDRSKLVIDQKLYRPNDIDNMYGDNSKAKKLLGWEYNMSFFDVLDLLIEEQRRQDI